jgi:hypothetical protein
VWTKTADENLETLAACRSRINAWKLSGCCLPGTAGYSWLLMARASAAWVLSSTSRTPFSVISA